MDHITLHELKKRFEREHPQETKYLESAGKTVNYEFAASVWRGYKNAFKSMGVLKE